MGFLARWKHGGHEQTPKLDLMMLPKQMQQHNGVGMQTALQSIAKLKAILLYG
jgi:hypothetical protein